MSSCTVWRIDGGGGTGADAWGNGVCLLVVGGCVGEDVGLGVPEGLADALGRVGVIVRTGVFGCADMLS